MSGDLDKALTSFPGTERYQVCGVLGEGAHGVVYRVYDRDLGQEVALKTLQGSVPEETYFLKREFRLLTGISHPNLVQLLELESGAELCFFTMELLEGRSLDRALGEAGERAGRPAFLASVLNCFRQLARGVQKLHAAGQLHRDLKPSNVLVDDAGRAVIVDFGLATPVPEGGAVADIGRFFGNPLYTAPEQVFGQASEASDWYAVGFMLFEALTRAPPFSGSLFQLDQAKRKGLDPKDPRLEDLPEPIAALLVALLDPKPERRPGAEAILEVLGPSRPSGRAFLPARVPFVGRRQELAELRACVDRPPGSGPRVLALGGRSGIGKSRLIQQLFSTLARDGATLALRGRCHPRESVSFKALDSIIDELSHHLSGLEADEAAELVPRWSESLLRLFPVLRRVSALADAAEGAENAEPAEDRRRGTIALRELLGKLGQRRRLVLAIDDVQWGDRDSAALLQQLLSSSEAPELTLIFSHRSLDESGEALTPFLELADQRLTLNELPEEDCRKLAGRVLGDEDPRIAAALRESAGSPFLLVQVSSLLKNRPPDAEIGGRLADAIHGQLRDLPEADRAILEAVALSVGPLEAELAFRAAGFANLEWPRLYRLMERSLLKGSRGGQDLLEPYHDRIGESLLGDLSPERARVLHRDLAEGLEALEGPDPQRLAHHYSGAGERARAALHYRLAGEQAEASLAFNRAAELYALVLDQSEGPAAAVRGALARALSLAGRGEASAAAYAQAARESEEPLAARGFERNAAEQWLRAGALEEGLGALRSVLARCGLRYPRSTLEIIVVLLACRVYLWLRGFGYRERAAEVLDPAKLERIDAAWSATLGLNMVDIMRSAYFQNRHSILALRAGEPSRVVRALTLEMVYRASEGGRRNRERSAALLRESEELALRTQDSDAIGFMHLCAGAAHIFTGRFREALDRLAKGERIFVERRDGLVWETMSCRMYRLWALAYLGELAELRAAQREFAAEARRRGDALGVMGLSCGAANLAFLVGDEPEEGRAAIKAAIAAFPEDFLELRHYYGALAEAHVDLYEGQGADAWRRIEDARPNLRGLLFYRMQYFRIELGFLRGRCALAAAAEPGAAAARLEAQALVEARRLGREDLPWAGALGGLLELGAAIAAARRSGEAPTRFAPSLRSRSELLDAAGFGLYAAAARFVADQLEGRPGNSGLTAQGVVRPDRLARLVIPGQSREGALLVSEAGRA